jgi:hypothetical protein
MNGAHEPAFPAGPGDGDGDARGGLIGDGAPGLALINAGDQHISHAQFDLTAILPAPIPWSTRTGCAPSSSCAPPNPAPSYPSRLALCAEFGRAQQWLDSGHRLMAGQGQRRRRYSSPWRKTVAES